MMLFPTCRISERLLVLDACDVFCAERRLWRKSSLLFSGHSANVRTNSSFVEWQLYVAMLFAGPLRV